MSDTWADGGEDELRKLVAEGLSANKIAKAMRTSRGAVIGKCSRLGRQLKGGPGGGSKPGRPRSETPERSVHVRQLAVTSRDGPSAPRRFSWEATP